MKFKNTLAVPAFLLAVCPAGAQPANQDIALDPDYREGVQYTTVERGNISEELYAAAETIAAARAGSAFPEGAVITMDDSRDGELHRILVMEKRAEWADLSDAGSWQFRVFSPDGSPDMNEDGARCQACHASRANDDYVFTRARMLSD
ncbi:cytochrome P460 family protein [Martelella radicis]|uniref:Cytochrome P460 domain-containing protein n=1 Tax=Martelella radicis TaxID=1397476 RepID=A0A7W6KK21_9HYPH|nr:cytochrome P460 family protein [Martelella radicis]MBB4121343.1 hypothetical protein [Martelella radicis]